MAKCQTLSAVKDNLICPCAVIRRTKQSECGSAAAVQVQLERPLLEESDVELLMNAYPEYCQLKTTCSDGAGRLGIQKYLCSSKVGLTVDTG